MPVTGPSSWIETIDEFAAHWALVDAALGLNPLLLLGGYTQGQFVIDRGGLAVQFATVETTENLRQAAAGTRDIQRANVRPRLLQFGQAVRGLLPGSRHVRVLPKVPQFGSSQGKWNSAMDDDNALWMQININVPPVSGFTPPLLLSGPYAQAQFAVDVANLKLAFTAISTTQTGLDSAREQRNVLFAPMYERMKQYREAVPARLGAAHPLSLTIPRLTPPAGATPDPVNASGVWNGGTLMGDLSWTPSLNVNLDYYSVRAHPGPRYKSAEETVVDSVPAGTENFSTDYGLVASGSFTLFRIYVVLTTGNERGSNTVRIDRP